VKNLLVSSENAEPKRQKQILHCSFLAFRMTVWGCLQEIMALVVEQYPLTKNSAPLREGAGRCF
jgi:hypothetical protein